MHSCPWARKPENTGKLEKYARNFEGSSQLFIDFSPSDRIEVIANSFDEYLEKMINWEFDFIADEFAE